MKRKALSILLGAALVFAAQSCDVVRYVLDLAPIVAGMADATGVGAIPGEPAKPGKKDGGSTSGQSGSARTGNVSGTQAAIIATAKSKIGYQYVYGATGPDTFDCSGLLYYAFKQAGVSIPRNSAAQYSYGKKISRDELMPCDFIFFSGSKISSTVGHVGMVLSYDKSTDTITFIHASSSHGVEIQKSTTDYYAKRYIGIRRML